PARKLVVGTPGKIIKDVTDEMLKWKIEGTKIYQQLPKDMNNNFKPCESLRSVPKFRKAQPVFYHTLKTTKSE
ncbi:MAG TPA: gamma carbonic anhydrase family protein, partial [Bacteroidia bacterium]|nr:gamma carbonic anhydrase family protein [Bacteroidia bacterium]